MLKQFFIIISAAVFSVCRVDACVYPPAFWCDSDEVAAECNATEACEKFRNAANGKRIKLTLLYETLCKDCQKFIIDEFYPKIYKFASDFVQFEFVPYGNVRKTVLPNGTVNIECQHGAAECSHNKLHNCVINVTGNDHTLWVPFVYCMEVAARAKDDPEKAKFVCYDNAKIDASLADNVEQCRNGPLGTELEQVAAETTANIAPHKHNSVPWILINDLSTTNMQIYQSGLLAALCAWYPGPKPNGCDFAESVKKQKSCGLSRGAF